MDAHSDIIIIGGGIIGLSCAHYLVQCGARVTVMDKDPIGKGASHGNCGLLYFSDVFPLCVPGAVTEEIKRSLLGTSPLYIKPTLNIKRLAWLMRFALNCRQRLVNESARNKYELLTYSLSLFKDLFSLDDLECDLETHGILTVFKEEKNCIGYAQKAEKLAAFALAPEKVAPADLRQMEPALLPDVAGAYHSIHDWYLRPDLLVSAWKRRLESQGVCFVENCRARDFMTHGSRIAGVHTNRGNFAGDALIVATGAWSSQLLAPLLPRLAVEPGKGYSITMNRPAPCPRYSLYFYEKNVVATPWKSGYRLGGTMEFSGYGMEMNLKRLQKLVTGAADYLKVPTGDIRYEEWTSLRPMTPDDMPVIGRIPGRENLIIATGHGMLGLTLATGTGKIASDLTLGRKPEVNIRPYNPERFS